jgi:hypothetical protein
VRREGVEEFPERVRVAVSDPRSQGVRRALRRMIHVSYLARQSREFQ